MAKPPIKPYKFKYAGSKKFVNVFVPARWHVESPTGVFEGGIGPYLPSLYAHGVWHGLWRGCAKQEPA